MNDSEARAYEARAQLLYHTAFQQGYTQASCDRSQSRWQSFVLGVVVGCTAFWAVGYLVIEFVRSCFS